MDDTTGRDLEKDTQVMDTTGIDAAGIDITGNVDTDVSQKDAAAGAGNPSFDVDALASAPADDSESKQQEEPVKKGFFGRFKSRMANDASKFDDNDVAFDSDAAETDKPSKAKKAAAPVRAAVTKEVAMPEDTVIPETPAASEEAWQTANAPEPVTTSGRSSGFIAGLIILVILMCGDAVMLFQTFRGASESTVTACFISAAALAAAVAMPWLTGHFIAKRRRGEHARYDVLCMVFAIVAWVLLLAGVMAVRYAVEDIPSTTVSVTMIVFMGALLLATAVIACVCSCIREEANRAA